MRTARIIARLNVGGPARHVVILDSGLSRLGYETLLLHGEVSENEASLERLVEGSRIRAQRIPGLGRRISPLSDLRAGLRIVHTLFRTQPDIVHTHTAKAGVLGRLAAALFNVTRRPGRRCLIVHTFHGNVLKGYFGAVASAAARTVERVLALLTDVVVVIADQQRREIVEQFRIAPAAKVRVIPLGLDLSPLLALAPGYSSLRQQLGFADASVVFGYVGRFVAIKDLGTMVRALAAALPEAPMARLLMVGDGETRSDLERQARGLGVSAAVVFTGWRDDLADVYGAIDVGILSSRNEGTPVALIEAMAAAKPVVATNVGGVSEVVNPGVTGLLTPEGDHRALGAAIVRLALETDDRERMGRAARQDVAARYAGPRLIRDMADVYREGLARKRGVVPTAL